MRKGRAPCNLNPCCVYSFIQAHHRRTRYIKGRALAQHEAQRITLMVQNPVFSVSEVPKFSLSQSTSCKLFRSYTFAELSPSSAYIQHTHGPLPCPILKFIFTAGHATHEPLVYSIYLHVLEPAGRSIYTALTRSPAFSSPISTRTA